jgi:hypothetical protein
MTNLSLLPKRERELIELERKAALMINDWHIGRINKADVKRCIASLPECDREPFRVYLNKFKGMK